MGNKWFTNSVSVKKKFLTSLIKKNDPGKNRTSFAVQKPQKPIINPGKK